MFRKILGAAAVMLAVHGGALAQTLTEGEVLGNFSPTPGPAVPTDLTGTAGFGLYGNGVGTAPSYQGYLAYSGSTQRTWQSKAGDSVNIMDYAAQYNCIPGDYTTDCTAAFNAAITAVYNYSQSNGGAKVLSLSGTVHVPASAGCFRIASAITMKQGISLMGEGGLGSCIMADDTDALSYGFIAYYGQPQVSNIFLYGCHWDAVHSVCAAPTAARTAILRSQTSVPSDPDIDRMLGLAIQNTLIWGFDTAIDVTTVGNLWLNNSYFQNVNTCVTARGFSFGVRMQGFQCTRADGDGLGAIGDGIVIIPHTYVGGVSIGPEAVEINQSQIFGFNNAIRLDKGNVAMITNSDVQAKVNGIRFKDIGSGLFIHNTYIGMDGSSINAGIFGEGTASTSNEFVNIDSNSLISTGTTGTNTGIKINESGLFGQHNVNITKNTLIGFTGRDIHVFGPNKVVVDNNNLTSTGAVNSIEFTSATAYLNFITRNVAVVSIVANATDLTTGAVRKCDNVVAGAVEPCSWAVTIDDTQTLSNKTFVAPALGSPSSVGTMPAFSLGGTVNGGGNQINNVVIGASTPLAGTFTTLQANTSLTSALQAGGTGAASTLTLESTSGAGTSDAIIGRTGSQTERFRVTTAGLFNIGPAVAPDTLLTVNGNTGASVGSTIGTQQLHLIAPDTTIGGVIADVFGAQGLYANRHANGTLASRAASGSNTTTFSIGAQHWDTMGYFSSGSLDFGTINTQSTSDHSGYMRIRTVAVGSTSLTERLRVQQGLGIGSVVDPGAGAVLLNPQTFSTLTACTSTIRGASAYVTDSSTNVWGATITGSGANNVQASCNGTNWTVAGK